MFIQFRRRNGEMYDCSLTHGLKPMDQLDGQGLGKSMIGKLVRKTSRKGMWIDHLKWAKDMTISVSYISAHQMLTSTERDLNNLSKRMACSMDSIQYRALFISFSSELWTKRTSWQRWRLNMGSTTWISTHCHWCSYSCYWVLCLLAAETNTSFYYTVSLGDDPMTWWQMTTRNHFRCGNSSTLSLLE